MSTTYKPTPLFGGAITASFPANFGDVSDIRQVPDNQEVYLDTNGFSSIVVDILERVEKGFSDVEAVDFHLQDLVEEDAGETRVWRRAEGYGSELPKGTPVYTLLATSPAGEKQRGRANEPDFVAILLTVIRLEAKKTDIVVAVNVPHIAGQYEAADVDFEHGKLGGLMERSIEWRDEVLRTFKVEHWGLFGEE